MTKAKNLASGNPMSLHTCRRRLYAGAAERVRLGKQATLRSPRRKAGAYNRRSRVVKSHELQEFAKTARRRPMWAPPETAAIHMGRDVIERILPHREPFLF